MDISFPFLSFRIRVPPTEIWHACTWQKNGFQQSGDNSAREVIREFCEFLKGFRRLYASKTDSFPFSSQSSLQCCNLWRILKLQPEKFGIKVDAEVSNLVQFRFRDRQFASEVVHPEAPRKYSWTKLINSSIEYSSSRHYSWIPILKYKVRYHVCL